MKRLSLVNFLRVRATRRVFEEGVLPSSRSLRRDKRGLFVATLAAVALNPLGCVDSREFGSPDGSVPVGETDAGLLAPRDRDAAHHAGDAGNGFPDGTSASPRVPAGPSSPTVAPGETGPTEPVTDEGCTEGTFGCNGDSRTLCMADGSWRAVPASEQCGGSLPVCTGSGVCAAFRLRGGISGLAQIVSGTSAPFVVRGEGFLTSARVCSERYCFSGGMVP